LLEPRERVSENLTPQGPRPAPLRHSSRQAQLGRTSCREQGDDVRLDHFPQRVARQRGDAAQRLWRLVRREPRLRPGLQLVERERRTRPELDGGLRLVVSDPGRELT
jgi:hypothetical protein